jgi:lysozyme family protein
MDLETYVKFIKRWEGGLSLDPSDSCSALYCPTPLKGKKYHTNMGICYSTWIGMFGKDKDERFLNMNSEDWFKVFKKGYWDGVRADEFKCFSVGVIVSGMAWGSGQHRAIITLQQALNNLGKNVAIDGKIGPKTLKAANELDDRILFDELIRLREAFFIAISKPGMKNAKFRRGWLNRLSDYYDTFRP